MNNPESGQSGREAGSLLLEAKNITKIFRTPSHTLEVLRGVDLDLKRGEMAALLGVSGSGKSTLLQILGRLDHPSSGTVTLDGIDLFALSEGEAAAVRNRRISFVYQSHRLLPEFSALENILMPLMIGRMAKREATERAAEALAAVGLSQRSDHKPGQMSGGEQQRVAIARAIVTNPDLLLADEPTGNLDRRTAEEVFELLRQLNHNRLLTCLMVTHNSELADRLDRRFHLVDGALQ